VAREALPRDGDGEFQTYAATDGAFNREHFFNKYPELQQLVAHLSDDDIDRLRRGGHDPVKIFSAYWHAARHAGQPTVILAKTKKGYGMGTAAQGRMTTHQQKKLDTDQLLAFRDRFALPLTDAQCDACEFVRRRANRPRWRTCTRAARSSAATSRARSAARAAAPPPGDAFAKFALEANGKDMSTTVAFVRMVGRCCRTVLGKRIVPIIADEARTFGMADLFRQIGIYSPIGQLYQPEDRDSSRTTRKAVDGQILEEGINEAGAIASWVAAATSYSAHGSRCCRCTSTTRCSASSAWETHLGRGRFALARLPLRATAGRTTLSGEGLQHQDGIEPPRRRDDSQLPRLRSRASPTSSP
jgi:pyruvate dehydrogenase E1 component